MVAGPTIVACACRAHAQACIRLCEPSHLLASNLTRLHGQTLIYHAYLSPLQEAIRDNFSLVYELLDEVVDFGYAQNCALDVLKMYINLGKQKEGVASAAEDRKMTSAITGARDWRREGIVHKKNEVFIDVLESVNLLLSGTGTVLRNDVTGAVMMKALLSGAWGGRVERGGAAFRGRLHAVPTRLPPVSAPPPPPCRHARVQAGPQRQARP